MEEWLETQGSNGFNVMFPYFSEDLDDDVEGRAGTAPTRHRPDRIRGPDGAGEPRPQAAGEPVPSLDAPAPSATVLAGADLSLAAVSTGGAVVAAASGERIGVRLRCVGPALQGLSAVDQPGRTRDVARLVGGEEGHRRRDVLRLADAA